MMSAETPQIQISQLISALSFALDLTEGQPMGHAVRSCMLGMRLAAATGLPETEQEDLYYALLLKDAGCSSNASKMFHILGTDEIAAKNATKTLDWRKVGLGQIRYVLQRTRTGRPMGERLRAMWDIALHRKQQTQHLVQIRCERGAHIARRIGLAMDTSTAIYSLDEHWDGGGYPNGLRGQSIPVMARILNLAQTLEVFHRAYGPEAAIAVARKRSGRWFDPELVRVARTLAKDGSLWQGIRAEDALAEVVAMEPERRILQGGEASLNNVCEAFAEVIDAKSHFTYSHSTGVTAAAMGIARTMGMDAETVTTIRRAALLHDVGKLSVPNAILEKPGKLTAEEWRVVRKHPYYTHEILRRIEGFEELTEIAAAHHEKLDGSGYYRGYTAEQLTLPMRILVVADIFDALAAERPYREGLPLEKVFSIMSGDTPHALDAECFEALVYWAGRQASATQAGREFSIPPVLRKDGAPG
ncbi:MAG TPA: HD domain-containing phosphohydrolase [Acidobacteriaceae bacterium]|jgi:putative nucleotidyltransferase with HDIG domain|nr:HD domain-containing phosphohydrolase [Acidobacteriaceae bacterium]